MSAVDVCALGDIPRQGAISVIVGSERVAIVQADDHIYAILDRCSHADVALSEGEVEGCAIECWLHGSSFDLRTGWPLSLPATEPVPVYRVTVEGSGPLARVLVHATPDGEPVPLDPADATRAATTKE